MSQSHPWRWRLEYLLARGFLGLLRILPLAVVAWLSRRLGDLCYWVLRSRRRVGFENIERALGLASTDPRARAILRESFRHFVLVPMELFLLDRGLRNSSPEELLPIERRPDLDELVAAGRGGVVVTGHIGNWEIMGALAPLQGLPLVSVGRRADNPYLHKILNGFRTRYGQEILDKDGAPLAIARALRRGKLIALLLDQHAGRRGIRVPFFGELASTFPSAALFARRFQVPIFPMFSVREDRRLFHVRAKAFPPIFSDPELTEEEDYYQMTRAYKRCLEQTIRENPGQWLWFHRRWRKGGKEPEPSWEARYAGAP